MFHKEADMMRPVVRWMKAAGLTARSEFVTPWGVCDLVGLRFNANNLARRIRLKQTRAVSSITRAMILLEIPDVETRRFVTLEKLRRHWTGSFREETIRRETDRLIADGFVILSRKSRLQKINGWMPLQDRLVAVELKLSRIEEAMRQALNNVAFADESYVALPDAIAKRVASRPSRWSRFFEAGVGLLGVTPHRCRVVVSPKKAEQWKDKPVQLYCVEKFWRSRLKGN